MSTPNASVCFGFGSDCEATSSVAIRTGDGSVDANVVSPVSASTSSGPAAMTTADARMAVIGEANCRCLAYVMPFEADRRRRRDNARASSECGTTKPLDDRLPTAVEIEHAFQTEPQLRERRSGALTLRIVRERRHAHDHPQQIAHALVAHVRVEPRREDLAIRGGRADGRKRGLEPGEIDFFGDVEQPGRHQRSEPGRQRVPSALIERVASGARRHAPADIDSEIAQRLPQRSRAVQGVRAPVPCARQCDWRRPIPTIRRQR